ncbi:MAG: ester cyclase [Chloroflexota bacterium]|nr:ester cyclase [Chloroflexota bacterium]
MNAPEALLNSGSGTEAPRRSRRSVLKGIGGGGVAAAAALALGPARQMLAQESKAENLPWFFSEFLDKWADAAESGDPAEVIPYYTKRAAFEDVPFGVLLTGPDEIEGFLTGFFGNYTDAKITWGSVFATEEGATAEAVFEGRFTGQLPGLPPGEGQPVTVRSAHVYEFDGERIKGQTLYFDAYGLLVQLGALPAPDTSST